MAIFRVGIVLAWLLILGLIIPTGAAQQDHLTHIAEATQATSAASTYNYAFNLDTQINNTRGIRFDSTLVGDGSISRLGDNSALSVALVGHLNLNGEFVPVSLDARVIDGVFYTTSADGARWTGVPLDELVPLMQDVVLSRFLAGFDEADISTDLLAGLSRSPALAANLLHVQETLNRIDIRPHLTVEEREISTLNGVDVTHYSTTVDMQSLVESDAMIDLIWTLTNLGAPDARLSPGGLAVYSRLVSSALAGSTFTIDHYVGAEYVHRVVADLDLAVDFSQLGIEGERVSAAVDLDLTLSDFDQTDAVDVPENAMMIAGLANMLDNLSDAGQIEMAQAQIEGEPILSDTPVTVQLSPDGPVDLIYSAAGNEVVTVAARSLEVPGAIDTTLEILDTDGARLAFNDDQLGGNSILAPFDSEIADFELPAPGDYVIRVATFSGAATGAIEVAVDTDGIPDFSAVPEADSSDNGDNDSSDDSTDDGNIDDIFQEDDSADSGSSDSTSMLATDDQFEAAVPDNAAYTYTFNGTTGQIVTITARATSVALDPRIELSDPNGTTLAENDDHTDTDPNLSTFDSRITDFMLPQTGTYTLTVSGFASTGGPFELTMVVSGEPIETETGATTELGLPESVDEVIEFAGDQYVLLLEANAGDVFTITAMATDGALDTQISVYDEADMLLVGNDEHGTSDTKLEFSDARVTNFIVPADGRYEIEIAGWSDTTGAFTLTVAPVATGAPLEISNTEVLTGEIAPNERFTHALDALQGDYVTITVRALSTGMDPQLILIDPNGAIIADNDDHGYFDDRSVAYLDSQIRNFAIPADGSYTIEVSGFQDAHGLFALTIATRR